MRKVLIATSNQDKFHIVSQLLKCSGLSQCEFVNLKMANLKSVLTETGTIEERAKCKAFEFKKELQNYDVIIGIDDGILLPRAGAINTELKKITKQIIEEKILKSGEIVKICRAYHFITRQNELSTVTIIPFSYKGNDNAVMKPNSYPLRQVLSPLSANTLLSAMSESETMGYYLTYSKENLEKIIRQL